MLVNVRSIVCVWQVNVATSVMFRSFDAPGKPSSDQVHTSHRGHEPLRAPERLHPIIINIVPLTSDVTESTSHTYDIVHFESAITCFHWERNRPCHRPKPALVTSHLFRNHKQSPIWAETATPMYLNQARRC